MLNLNNNNDTNQILNNFKKISKLYSPLTQIQTDKIPLFTINSQNKIFFSTQEIFPAPYYFAEPFKFLYLVFNTPGVNEIILKTKNSEISINKETISLILGFLTDLKEPHMTFEKAISSDKPHLAFYLSTIQKIDPISLSLAYFRLGFYGKAITELKDATDEKKWVILSKIYRKTGELKKSLEALNEIKSKELEVDKNLEYAWLHLSTQKPENAYKIFKYYSSEINDSRLSDIYTGMAMSILSFDKNPLQAADILTKIIESDLPDKTGALKLLSDIYLEIKDYIKAEEAINKLMPMEPSPQLLYEKAVCEFNLSKDEDAFRDLTESAVFILEKPVSFLKLVSAERIKKTISENIVLKKEDEKKEGVIEAVLSPEDISSTPNITKPSQKKPEFISTFEMSELKYEIKKEEGDELSNMAFSFSRILEEEFNKKVYFNYEGIDDIERKLRLTHMTEIPENEKNEVIKLSSAFLLFFLKERFKAKIIKYSDMDMWSWPAVIKNKSDMELVTYPAARAYLIDSPTLPEQGWLRKYINYLSEFMNLKEDPPAGSLAVKNNIKSNEQKIFDAKIEHKKILLVSQDIEESSNIPHNSSALHRLETEIKKRYKPQIPPTTEGWKILRCYAHIFLEMIIKDFSPEWYNTEKNDGLWSFKISQDTFIFPIGKVYKAASAGESLSEYFETLSRNFKKR